MRRVHYRNDCQVIPMSAPQHTTFPIAEGVGIFVGVVAWYLLADGSFEVLRALLIAIPCSLVWFGVRCWKDLWRNDKRR